MSARAILSSALVLAAHFGSAFNILLVLAVAFPVIFAFGADRKHRDGIVVSMATGYTFSPPKPGDLDIHLGAKGAYLIQRRDALTVYLNKQPPSCDGMTTDQIIDTTDTQTPQRSVKQRWGEISCLDNNIDKHDGRIRPVFE